MSDIVETVAKAMFEQVHGYHPDLNWDNAHQEHGDLYLKFARIAEPIFSEAFRYEMAVTENDE